MFSEWSRVCSVKKVIVGGHSAFCYDPNMTRVKLKVVLKSGIKPVIADLKRSALSAAPLAPGKAITSILYFQIAKYFAYADF